MKITKQRLKKIIKEEVGRIIAEGNYSADDEKKASSILSRAIGIADQSLKAAGKMGLSHVSNLKPHEVKHLEAALVKAGLAQDEFDVDAGKPGSYSGSVRIYINQGSYPFCFDPDRGFYDC